MTLVLGQVTAAAGAPVALGSPSSAGAPADAPRPAPSGHGRDRPTVTIKDGTVVDVDGGGSTQRGRLTPAPAMSLTVHQLAPARRGGHGVAEVVLTRREDAGPPLRHLRVRVDTPAGSSIREPGGTGWACRTSNRGRSATCHHRSAIPRGDNPAEIVLEVAVADRARRHSDRGHVTMRARADWRNDPGAAGRGWTTSGDGRLEVRVPLRVDLRVVEGRTAHVFDGPDERDRQLNLVAGVRGVGDGHVSARWRQVEGPPTRFLGDVLVESASQTVTQTVQLQHVPARPTIYRFAVLVHGNGHTVRREVGVRVTGGQQLGSVDPRLATFERLARESQAPLDRVAHRSTGSTVLRIDGPRSHVAPGSRHVLTAQHRGLRAASYEWVVERDGTLETVSTTRSYTMAAPATPGSSDVVELIVRTRNGRTLQRAFILSTRQGAPGGRPRLLAADEPPGGDDIAAFCRTYDEVTAPDASGDITVTLAEDASLVFPVAKATADAGGPDAEDCADGEASLTITDAVFTHASGQEFTGVEASFDPSGITLKRLRWTVPKALNPVGSTTPTFTLTGEARVPLGDGEFQAASGDMTVAPITVAKVPVLALSWIPLPGGWSFKDGGTVLHFVNADDGTEDDPIEDGTLRLSQMAGGPADATVTMSADYRSTGASAVRVVVANVGLGTTTSGDTVQASGTGLIDLTDGGPNTGVHVGITCLHEGEPAATCALVRGLSMQDLALDWTRQGIRVSGTAAVAYGQGRQYAFTLAGDYRAANDWGLQVTAANDWDLGNGMAVRGVSGQVARRPVKDSDPPTSELTAGVTGTLTGLSFSSGITVEHLTATLTNACPADDEGCDTREIRLTLDAGLRATLPGGSAPTSLVVNSEINLTTLVFSFEAGAADLAFGPAALRLKDVRFILTNDPGSGCVPKGTDLTKATALRLGVRATTSILKQDMTVEAQFDSAGMCLWGRRGGFTLASGVAAVDGLVTYSTYAGGAELHQAGQPVKSIDKPGQIALDGQLSLPPSLRDTFGIPAGTVHYDAALQTDLTAGSFAISYVPTQPVVIYRGASSRLSLDGIRFSFAYRTTPPQVDLKAAADGVLAIDGSGSTPASRTPLGVSLGFAASGTGFQVTMQAGVNTGGGVVSNAFGQQGLTVRQLAVSARFGVPLTDSELSVNADVTLPAKWNDAIGLSNNPPLTMAFKLSKADPCLIIRIGQEGGTATVVDIGRRGLLTARYLQLVIAPKGCALPTGSTGTQQIAPGFAFAFDGEIAKAPVTVVLNVGLSDGLTIKGVIDLPQLDLYAVRLSDAGGGGRPRLTLDIDTAAKRYNVAVDASVEVGSVAKGVGGIVRVKGQINTSDPSYTTVDLTGNGALVLGKVSATVSPLDVHVKMAKGSADRSANYAYGSARISFNILGIGISAAGNLDYRGGQLATLGVSVGARLDILVAKLDGTIAFTYCMGTITPVRADGTGNGCSLFATADMPRRTPAMRISAFGYYRYWWWGWHTKGYADILWDHGSETRAALRVPLAA